MTTLARAVAVCLALVLIGPAFAQDEGLETRIERLVEGLGADDPEVRDASQRELESIGAPALPALKVAKDSEDPEVSLRATESIDAIGGGRRSQPQREETRRPGVRGGPQQPPMPDMNELMRESLKQLQDQLPPEFREMFEMFGEMPGTEQQDQGQQDQERNGSARPRVRVWSWSNQPNQPQQGSPTRAGLEGELGLRGGRASAALRAQLGISGNEGLVVGKVIPGGYADKHGLQLYDVIVAADGRSVRSARDLAPLRQQACQIQLYRKAKLETLELPALSSTAERRPQRAPAPEADPKQDKDKPEGERSF